MPGPILVTGATGFVGANLCHYFKNVGHDVLAVTGPSQKDWRLPKDIPRVEVDLLIETDVRHLVRQTRPFVIFHCAAYGAYSSQTDIARIYRTNVDVVRYFLEVVRELKEFHAFVQAGSSSEYGTNCAGPHEEDMLSPDSHYAVSKISAQKLVELYGRKYGVPAWTFRLYSVYGPMEDASRLIPRVLEASRDRKLPPMASPNISRDFVSIWDVCNAYAALLMSTSRLIKGDVYNIGFGEKITLEDLVDTVQEVFGFTTRPEWGGMADRHWDHADWYSNPEKAERFLQWKARDRLGHGLQKTAEWMMANHELVQAAKKHSVLA